MSFLTGKELSAVLVSEFLDWCDASQRACKQCPFLVCVLLRPGEEVQCIVTGRRARLPERAVRLVAVAVPGFPRCVHAVTSSGRSVCVNASSASTFLCREAAIFREVGDHGGPTALAYRVSDKSALQLVFRRDTHRCLRRFHRPACSPAVKEFAAGRLFWGVTHHGCASQACWRRLGRGLCGPPSLGGQRHVNGAQSPFHERGRGQKRRRRRSESGGICSRTHLGWSGRTPKGEDKMSRAPAAAALHGRRRDGRLGLPLREEFARAPSPERDASGRHRRRRRQAADPRCAS